MKSMIRKASCFIGAFLLGIAMTSCGKDSDDNLKSPKVEFQWSKAEFTIKRGHLHGVNFHGNPENALFPTQEFIFEKDASGNIVRKNKAGKIFSENEAPIIMQAHWQYALEIVYYNDKGERINSILTTEEALPKYQHFFSVDKYTNTKTSQVITNQDGLMDYAYRDTNPENVQKDLAIDPDDPRKGRSKLTNDNLGLKGYFSPKMPYVKFDMDIFLLQIGSGTKYINNVKSNGTNPFNAPSSDLLNRSQKVFSVKIPVHIFTEPNSGKKGDYERYISDLAAFFSKTEQEIRDLLKKASDEGENSSYWM